MDFKYAEKLGRSVKLFGSSRIEGDKVTAFVAPVMVGLEHPLYAVNDVYNGIVIKGNMLGTSMYFGSGAGKLPTASAVVADMMEAAVYSEENIPLGWTEERLEIEPLENASFRYFLRISGNTQSGKERVREVFPDGEIVELSGYSEFGVLTSKMKEAEFNEKKAAISDVIGLIRAE